MGVHVLILLVIVCVQVVYVGLCCGTGRFTATLEPEGDVPIGAKVRPERLSTVIGIRFLSSGLTTLVMRPEEQRHV